MDFNIKKFNSGEWDVRLSKLDDIDGVVVWNWFTEPDILIPILKGDILKRKRKTKLDLICNYLPYSRQDRIFENGLGLPKEVILKILRKYFDTIRVMGLHSREAEPGSLYLENHLIRLRPGDGIVYVFPDEHAPEHFIRERYELESRFINYKKHRIDGAPQLQAYKHQNAFGIKYLICDDICDGGRTFIECANHLKAHPQYNGKPTELLIYHAFLTYGLDDLKACGISKIHIINPDSYAYIINKYPNDLDYFTLHQGEWNV